MIRRHLTQVLADLADPALGAAAAGGEGFEVIVNGSAVPWRQTCPPRREGQEQVWELAQVAGPLRSKVHLCLHPSHRAGQWRVELTNAGSEPATIDAVYPLVLRFPRIAGPWRTLTAGGGTSENFYPPRAYAPRERLVFGGEVRIQSPADGRSSNQHLPLMLAVAGERQDGPGLFCGLEYSGQWFLCLRHVNNAPFFRGELKIGPFSLGAGESLDLPACHVGFFTGGLEGGTNALRRYLRDCICPPPGSANRALPPVSYDHWFGIQNDFDEPLLRRQVDRAAELGAEYWVHDAGWFEGGFPAGVGNWHRADPNKYPKGLGGLADLVRQKGMKFGLWFEIERAAEGTWAASEFLQLFFPPREAWCGRSYHLNLARPDAVDWALATLTRWVRELDLEWVRFDYNLEPAPFLRAADPSGRIELEYCQGLYRLLDGLRREHPQLLIENCASGGRRIDLGTLRRTHLAWISDQTTNPHISRYMQCRLGRLLPSHLANSAVVASPTVPAHAFGDMDILSRMCGALSFNGDIASWPAACARRVRKWVDAYKQVRHLLAGDFWQLLPTPTTDRDWDAVQFAAPDGGESLVFAFRMGGGQERAALPLKSIDPTAQYALSNLARPGRPRSVPGARLHARGLTVRLAGDSGVCLHLAKQ